MAKKLVTAMVLATASFASMAVWAEPVELAPYKAEYSITRGGCSLRGAADLCFCHVSVFLFSCFS